MYITCCFYFKFRKIFITYVTSVQLLIEGFAHYMLRVENYYSGLNCNKLLLKPLIAGYILLVMHA